MSETVRVGLVFGENSACNVLLRVREWKSVRMMEVKAGDIEVASSRSVSIVGTGNFGVAIAKRLIRSGYDVSMGSRYPGQRAWLLEADGLSSVQLCSIREAITKNDVIILALHLDHMQETLEPHCACLAGKLLIDVSNRKKQDGTSSNTEKLQERFPQCTAVKAFNVISAFSLENDHAGESTRVLVAGSDVRSREIVMRMSRDMGLVPVDMGVLRAARQIEELARELFPLWRFPLIVAGVIFLVVTVYLSIRLYTYTTPWRLDQFFLALLNKSFAVVALELLSLAYLPGCLAALLQLWRGTNHRPFPKWLDYWLRCRKQIGQTSLLFVVAHLTASVLIMSPSYFPSWFHHPPGPHRPAVNSPNTSLPAPCCQDPKLMNWMGESSLLLAVLALVLLLLLAVSSLPGVGHTLRWREWRLLHSRLGHVTMALAAAHVIVLGAPYWVTYPFSKTVTKLKFLSVQAAVWTLLVRLLLLFPCLSRPLSRIRKGWERSAVSTGQSANGAV